MKSGYNTFRDNLVVDFILTKTKCLTLPIVIKQTVLHNDLDEALDKSAVSAQM